MWQFCGLSRALALLLATTGVLYSVSTKAQPGSAQLIVEEAREAYDAGEFLEAADLYERAFQIDPHPVLRFNQARCHQELGDYLGALDLFYEALDMRPSQRVRGEIVTQVEIINDIIVQRGFRLENVNPEVFVRLATITITSRPDGADAFIDDEYLGTTPIESLYLMAGSYEVDVAMDGYQPYFRNTNIRPRQSVNLHAGLRLLSGTESYSPSQPGQLTVEGPAEGMEIYIDDFLFARTPLSEASLAPGRYRLAVRHPAYEDWDIVLVIQSDQLTSIQANPVALPVEQEEPGWTNRHTGYTTLVGGGVLLVTGAIFGILAKVDADLYHANPDMLGRDSVRDSALTEALVADILLVGSAALLVTSAVLIFLLGADQASEQPAVMAEGGLDIGLIPLVEGWSISLGGRF